MRSPTSTRSRSAAVLSSLLLSIALAPSPAAAQLRSRSASPPSPTPATAEAAAVKGVAARSLLETVGAALRAKRTGHAALLIREAARSRHGAGLLLDEASVWLLRPEPEVATAAVDAVRELAGDRSRPWEPDGAVARAMVRLGAVVDRGGPNELRLQALDALAAIAAAWNLTIDPGYLARLAETSDSEAIQDAAQALQGEAREDEPAE